MESIDAFEKMFDRLGLLFDRDIAEKLQKYTFLLNKWNNHINLTASNEWSLIEALLQEGIWASKFYPENTKTHLDIGSGAGFPAIPIRTMVPHIQLDMIDTRMKRVSFLETVASELDLSGTCAYHARIEDYLDQNSKKWDCISWKGIKISNKAFSKLLNHADHKTQFWIFHGRELAAEDPESIEGSLKLLRREKFPQKTEWILSMYLVK
jgi:16S rRNA (guanine(527)-N(7))-methyltransferase RsmG